MAYKSSKATADKDRLFAYRELSTILNNTVAAMMRPASLHSEIPENRRRKTRYVASGLLEKAEELIASSEYRPQELSFMFVCAAFALHLKYPDQEQEPLPYAEWCSSLGLKEV